MTIFGRSIRVIWREEGGGRREEEEGGGRRKEGGEGRRREEGSKRKRGEEDKHDLETASPLISHLHDRMTVDLNNLVVSLWKQELADVKKQQNMDDHCFSQLTSSGVSAK